MISLKGSFGSTRTTKPFERALVVVLLGFGILAAVHGLLDDGHDRGSVIGGQPDGSEEVRVATRATPEAEGVQEFEGARVSADAGPESDGEVNGSGEHQARIPLLPDVRYEVVVDVDVLVAESMAPASGAWVQCRVASLYHDEEKVVSGRTGEDGHVSLKVPPGQAFASARQRVAGVLFIASASANLLPESDSRLTLVLSPADSVVGRVVDATSGTPIEGALVTGTDGAQDAVTDREGRFVLEPWRTEAEGGIYVRADGYTQDATRMVVRRDGSWEVPARFGVPGTEGPHTPYVEFRLKPERVIVGEIVDSNDQPWPGVGVCAEGTLLVTKRYGRSDAAETRSDAVGRFELRGLHPDVSHTVWIVPSMGTARALLVPAGPDLVDLGQLRIVENASLEGRVVDLNGLPLVGIEVTARSIASFDSLPVDTDPRGGLNPVRDGSSYLVPLDLSTRTGPEGDFRFDGLPTGDLELKVASFSGKQVVVETQTFQGQTTRLAEDLRIEEDLGAVYGHVSTIRDPSDLCVELIDPYGGSKMKSPVAPDGTFLMRGLRNSESGVLVVKEGDRILWEGVIDASLSPLDIQI